MKLRRLEVENFRGIQSLDWRHIADTAALVGPGDSGKSTILDAIERVLSSKWNVPFDDTDFWSLKTDKPIVIRATLTDLAWTSTCSTARCVTLGDGDALGATLRLVIGLSRPEAS
jgi:predicted ATP-binding protein involved in virulence